MAQMLRLLILWTNAVLNPKGSLSCETWDFTWSINAGLICNAWHWLSDVAAGIQPERVFWLGASRQEFIITRRSFSKSAIESERS